MLPDLPNVRAVSERFTNKPMQNGSNGEFLMAYPAANVRIEKTDE